MAEKMVFSGKIYTAAELHEMGVVDVLAEDGMGEQAVYDFVEQERALLRLPPGRLCGPPDHQPDHPRRARPHRRHVGGRGPLPGRRPIFGMMERLATAQDRRWAADQPGRVARAMTRSSTSGESRRGQ